MVESHASSATHLGAAVQEGADGGNACSAPQRFTRTSRQRVVGLVPLKLAAFREAESDGTREFRALREGADWALQRVRAASSRPRELARARRLRHRASPDPSLGHRTGISVGATRHWCQASPATRYLGRTIEAPAFQKLGVCGRWRCAGVSSSAVISGTSLAMQAIGREWWCRPQVPVVDSAPSPPKDLNTQRFCNVSDATRTHRARCEVVRRDERRDDQA